MRRTARPTPRAAFTLIELLVVIVIMALLAALVAGGIGQVRNGQMTKSTEQTMSKLQLALNGQWSAVADEARGVSENAISDPLLAIAGGDAKRAKSLLFYMKLKQEFPETFAEVQNPNTVSGKDAAGNTVTSPPLPRLSVFANIPAGPSGLTAEQEGAVLLYLIVANKAKKGVPFQADDATQGAQGAIGTFTVFKDAWGTPLTFIRTANANNLASLAEVDGPPYVKAGLACRDPFDLPVVSPAMPRGRLEFTGTEAGSWALNRDTVAGQLGATANRSRIAFDGSNKVLTVVSAGPDKLFWAATPAPPGGDETDNLYGHRLLRQGNKGD